MSQRRSGALLVCLAAAFAGCNSHVSLSAPPASAPLAERQEAYRLLRPVSAAKIYRGGAASSVDSEMTLGNGVTVSHPEDILPVVPEDSTSAVAVRKSMSRDSTASTCTLISALSAVAFGVLLFGVSSSSRSDLPKIGLLTTGLSAGGFGISSYLFHQAASDDALNAYHHYDEGLRKKLSLCVGANCGTRQIHDTRVDSGDSP